MKKKVIAALVSGAVLAGAVVAWGAVINTSMGTQPNVTPQLRIIEPSPNFVAGEPIPVKIAYENFDLQPQLRCNPAGPCAGSTPQTVVNGFAQGHIHVYFQRTDGLFSNVDSDSFCIPAIKTLTGPFEGTVEGNCPALPRGRYRVTAEFQSNSHINVLKAENKPQDVPTSDAIRSMSIGGGAPE